MSLRVLHVIYDDPGNPWVAGGGSVRVFELYRRLLGRVEVRVLTGNYPGATNGSVDGVEYVRMGASRPYALSRLTFALAANRALRREAYDAAVFDFSSYTPVFVPRDRPAGITVHHLSGPTAAARWGRVGGRGLAELERRMLRRATRFSATSKATADLLARAAPGIPIDLVYAGVPDELFALERSPDDYLLYFGRLDVFQKGLDTLLEALARLVRTRQNIELRIAGRGKDARRVQELAGQLGVAGNVRMLGAVSEAERQELFQGAAMLLMPSRFEGFGMVAAEAMAAGVPVVAAAAGSLPEVVAPPDGGVLVEPGDAAALASAIERLLDDPSERERLSQSARRSAERFRWATVAEAHYRFLERVAANRAGGGSGTTR